MNCKVEQKQYNRDMALSRVITGHFDFQGPGGLLVLENAEASFTQSSVFQSCSLQVLGAKDNGPNDLLLVADNVCNEVFEHPPVCHRRQLYHRTSVQDPLRSRVNPRI